MKSKILSLIVLSVVLLGCGQEKISDKSVFAGLEVGKTTIKQMKATYPDASKEKTYVMGFGDRDVTEKSDSLDSYIIDKFYNFGKQKKTGYGLMFDRDNQILQMLIVVRPDNNIDALEKELKAAGFKPYPELTPADFEILKTPQTATPEKRKQALKERGIKEFKKDNIYAQLIPKSPDKVFSYTTLYIMNLDYELTHRANWEKEQAGK